MTSNQNEHDYELSTAGDDTNNASDANKTENTADGMDVDYINEKLKEIAKLKAQLKRIDAMNKINKDIEKHLSTRSQPQVESATENTEDAVIEPEPQPEPKSESVVISENVIEEPIKSTVTLNDVENTRAELLTTLTGMFTDYASDLREQAESLRAERLRITQLKEKLIASRKPT